MRGVGGWREVVRDGEKCQEHRREKGAEYRISGTVIIPVGPAAVHTGPTAFEGFKVRIPLILNNIYLETYELPTISE